MNDIQLHINKYLDYCSQQKRLDQKTIKAYRIDLDQFSNYISETQLTDITQDTLELYISYLHQNYQPKTVKRKIASLKAMFHYFEYKGLITQNPFSKIQIRFREPVILPKTIPLHTIEYLLKVIYSQQTTAKTAYQRKNAVRDAAVCELLFATGMRISELCSCVEIRTLFVWLSYKKINQGRRILPSALSGSFRFCQWESRDWKPV